MYMTLAKSRDHLDHPRTLSHRQLCHLTVMNKNKTFTFFKVVANIGVARILSAGVHFFSQKSWRPFFSRRRLNIPPNLSHPAKTPKNWLLLWLRGALRDLRGALTHFPCKLGLKKIFFTALGGAGAPTAPPGYAYGGKMETLHEDQLRNIQQFVRAHPDTKTLLFHMRFPIFSDTLTLVCLFIFIVFMFVFY